MNRESKLVFDTVYQKAMHSRAESQWQGPAYRCSAWKCTNRGKIKPQQLTRRKQLKRKYQAERYLNLSFNSCSTFFSVDNFRKAKRKRYKNDIVCLNNRYLINGHSFVTIKWLFDRIYVRLKWVACLIAHFSSINHAMCILLQSIQFEQPNREKRRKKKHSIKMQTSQNVLEMKGSEG